MSVSAEVHVPHSNWTLVVQPAAGWVPSWRDPMLAMVVIASAAIGLLVAAVLVSRHQQAWLLKEMKLGGGPLGGGVRAPRPGDAVR